MFDQVYDNGTEILGKVYALLEYIRENWKTCEWQDQVEDVIKELEQLYSNDIVAINYDNPMGYTTTVWTYENIINKP